MVKSFYKACKIGENTIDRYLKGLYMKKNKEVISIEAPINKYNKQFIGELSNLNIDYYNLIRADKIAINLITAYHTDAPELGAIHNLIRAQSETIKFNRAFKHALQTYGITYQSLFDDIKNNIDSQKSRISRNESTLIDTLNNFGFESLLSKIENITNLSFVQYLVSVDKSSGIERPINLDNKEEMNYYYNILEIHQFNELQKIIDENNIDISLEISESLKARRELDESRKKQTSQLKEDRSIAKKYEQAKNKLNHDNSIIQSDIAANWFDKPQALTRGHIYEIFKVLEENNIAYYISAVTLGKDDNITYYNIESNSFSASRKDMSIIKTKEEAESIKNNIRIIDEKGDTLVVVTNILRTPVGNKQVNFYSGENAEKIIEKAHKREEKRQEELKKYIQEQEEEKRKQEEIKRKQELIKRNKMLEKKGLELLNKKADKLEKRLLALGKSPEDIKIERDKLINNANIIEYGYKAEEIEEKQRKLEAARYAKEEADRYEERKRKRAEEKRKLAEQERNINKIITSVKASDINNMIEEIEDESEIRRIYRSLNHYNLIVVKAVCKQTIDSDKYTDFYIDDTGFKENTLYYLTLENNRIHATTELTSKVILNRSDIDTLAKKLGMDKGLDEYTNMVHIDLENELFKIRIMYVQSRSKKVNKVQQALLSEGERISEELEQKLDSFRPIGKLKDEDEKLTQLFGIVSSLQNDENRLYYQFIGQRDNRFKQDITKLSLFINRDKAVNIMREAERYNKDKELYVVRIPLA